MSMRTATKSVCSAMRHAWLAAAYRCTRNIAQCREERAKLDRLARNVHFVSGLIESGVDFVAADAPHANKTMIQLFAVMAEWERDQISARTRAALAAAKARGVSWA